MKNARLSGLQRKSILSEKLKMISRSLKTRLYNIGSTKFGASFKSFKDKEFAISSLKR